MQKMQPTNKDELWLAMYTVHQVHVASMHSLEIGERVDGLIKLELTCLYLSSTLKLTVYS